MHFSETFFFFIDNEVPYKTIPGIIDLKNIVVHIERLVTSK